MKKNPRTPDHGRALLLLLTMKMHPAARDEPVAVAELDLEALNRKSPARGAPARESVSPDGARESSPIQRAEQPDSRKPAEVLGGVQGSHDPFSVLREGGLRRGPAVAVDGIGRCERYPPHPGDPTVISAIPET